MKKKKILAVASAGGHWIQLKRLVKAFDGHEVLYLSVSKEEPVYDNSNGEKYYAVTDATRNHKFALIKQFYSVAKIVFKLKPHLVISTGSSIGLMSLFWGKLRGCKTVWIDSIANYDRLSMSGRLSRPLANYHLTQWEHLEKGKTKYIDSVI